MAAQVNKSTDVLKSNYDKICDDYLSAFCRNYDLVSVRSEAAWVGGESGTIVEVGDYLLDFHGVIKYAVDNNLHDWLDLIRWYDYTLFAHSFNLPAPNFKSWTNGCPRLSKEAQQKIIDKKTEFEALIEQYKSSI